jgi:hypothetical protein
MSSLIDAGTLRKKMGIWHFRNSFFELIFWKCKFSDSMTSSPKSGLLKLRSLKLGSQF